MLETKQRSNRKDQLEFLLDAGRQVLVQRNIIKKEWQGVR